MEKPDNTRKPRTHGFYQVDIIDRITGLKLKYCLDGGYLLFEKHNVKVGDSVSKNINSPIMTFYNRKKGIYEENFNNELFSTLQNP